MTYTMPCLSSGILTVIYCITGIVNYLHKVNLILKKPLRNKITSYLGTMKVHSLGNNFVKVLQLEAKRRKASKPLESWELLG